MGGAGVAQGWRMGGAGVAQGWRAPGETGGEGLAQQVAQMWRRCDQQTTNHQPTAVKTTPPKTRKHTPKTRKHTTKKNTAPSFLGRSA